MDIKGLKNLNVYKKLDPPVRKELNRLQRLATKSITDHRVYEAYRDCSYEPYLINPNGSMYFAISTKQHKILISKIRKLDLNNQTKTLVYERTVKFFTDFRYEYIDRIHFRKVAIEKKGEENLRKKFENEIDNILSRYRKEFDTPDFSYKLAQFQSHIMKLYHEIFDEDPLAIMLQKEVEKMNPDAKNRHQVLIDRFAPRNRPSYESYAPYLYDLANIIQKEKKNYNPLIVSLIASLQNTPFDIFDSFVINKASIRSIISKHRRDMNKAKKN